MSNFTIAPKTELEPWARELLAEEDREPRRLRGRERDVAQFDATVEPEETRPTIELDPAKLEEPGWMARARDYNRRHAALADQFNQLTGGSCVAGDELDPRHVATWQVRHKVPPDGRVGQATVAAAHRDALMAPAIR